MPFVCKGSPCMQVQVKPNAIEKHYVNGVKYCSICAVYMLVQVGRCPCCKTKLRCKPVNRQDREQYN